MNSAKTTEAALRWLGVCCALANTVLHTLITPDHLEEKLYIGVLFAVGSAAMLFVAVCLATSRYVTVAWSTGALVSLGMIALFLLSRTVGLPQGYYEESWELPYGPLTLIVEGLFVAAFLGWLPSRNLASN
ncbi:hypothetical protein ACWD4B_19300 [Streptomyces sp. NPDC002536]